MQKIFFFATGKNGSRAIAPEEHFTPILALTLKLTQTLTTTGKGRGQFSLGEIRNEKPKRNEKQENKEKINKTKEAKFYQIKTNFSETF